MSVVGIICEYNPFHEGHKYHIQKAKEYTGADAVAAVMSGDFVQRGEPAVTDKYTRAQMALSEGADLVFELPVRYVISSAEDFAYGGILALESLSFVDAFCFGSECGDLGLLERAAEFFVREPRPYKERLAVFLRDGMSYPAAREKAFRETFEDVGEDLFSPNNILGIEYIKAAKRLNSHMKPVAVKRQGMGYLETGNFPEKGFLSATAIRENIKSGNLGGMPAGAEEIFATAWKCLDGECFWRAVSYAIRDKWEELEEYKDVSEELASRFRSSWYKAVSLDDFVNRCKTKNITMSRVKRCVLQVLLGVKKTESEGKLPYIRLLGMRKEASAYLGQIKDTVLLGRLAKDMEKLGSDGRLTFQQDLRAADLYRSVQMSESKEVFPDEFKRPVIVI